MTVKKTSKVEIRCTDKQKARLRWQARHYGYRSNVSEMTLDWMLNGPARYNPNRKQKKR